MNAVALPFVLPLFVGAALAFLLAADVWRRRAVPGAALFGMLLLLIAYWSASEGLETLSPELAAKESLDRWQYLAVDACPILWMYLGALLSGRARWFVRWGWVALSAFGLAVAAIVITGDSASFVWTRVWLDELSPVPMIRVDHGWLFWLNSAMIYTLFIAGGVLFVSQEASGQRGSRALTVFGVSLGLIGGLVNAAGLTPFGIADATVYGVTFCGITIAFAHFRYNLLDAVFGVLPVAHEMVVAGLEDGVLVVGAGRHVLYANPSARRILALGDENLGGEPLNQRTIDLLGLTDVGDDAHASRRDVVMSGEPDSSHYDLRITPLVRSRVAIGRLLVLHDVTERKRHEKQLEHLAAHDPLTGIANRRALEMALTSALRRISLGEPSALMYIDADGFKAVNDTLGHSAGDRVLALLASSIGQHLRSSDLVARVGGDEFAVLLTGSDTSRAHPVAERIRREVAQNPFVIGAHGFRITLSIGLVGLSGSMTSDAALTAADAAMYLAKQRGRDRVVVAEDENAGVVVS